MNRPRPSLNLLTGGFWTEPEDKMGGWKDVRVGSGQYLGLKENGDKATLVFLGEPFEQALAGANGKTKRRYLFNVATAEAKDKAMIYTAGPTQATDIKTALKDGELVGKVSLTITRRGASGDRDTKYELGTPRKLSPAEVKRFAALELVDLAAEPLPTGGKF
jgi:hypothetical protein